ncbi:MAG: response regulator transcription factor [Actinomycetota bacterium]|nr:response regulator transcription factor [Actinomycetota bacterium]
MTAKLLVVDDDHSLIRALRIGLSARGYDVSTARNGHDALSEAALNAPDVVLLDLGLPDMDGLEVCRRIRQWTDIPVIVLSALGAEDRKVAALDGGADDYVTKPFGMAELEARIRVALRHRKASRTEEQPSVIELGTIRIDFPSRQVSRNGQPVELTAREFDLLGFLAANAGKVCTHRLILESVWGAGYGHEVHYLRVYANRLRKKLGDDEGRLLRTNPGVGYQLVEEGDG